MVQTAWLVPAAVGIGAGILISIISGYSLMFKIGSIRRADGWRRMAWASSLTAYPAFWFGGPWLPHLLGWIPELDWIPWYIASLAVIMAAVALYPLWKLIIETANDFGSKKGR